MKAAVHVGLPHHGEFGRAFAKGLERHGIAAVFADYDAPAPCDFAVIWGWRQTKVIGSGVPVLCLERGHIQPRNDWVSAGWNGLAGRGTYPKARDGGSRWNRHHAHHMKPPSSGGTYALVMGQTPGDAALQGRDIYKWLADACHDLRANQYRVRYRPHPQMLASGDLFCPEGAIFSQRSLEDDLSDAMLAVTFNSTSAVEAVLYGVPTLTFDEGSMAWPVTAHRFEDAGKQFLREPWAHDLAWAQWLKSELEDGTAWEAIKTCL